MSSLPQHCKSNQNAKNEKPSHLGCIHLHINKIHRYSKRFRHGFNCHTLVRFQKLGIYDSSDLSHVIPEVWMQIAVQLNLLRQAS